MEPEQAALESIVKAFVDHPEAVVVERSLDNLGVLLTLTVHPEDMGKVIGKSGKTAEALRVLLRVVGMKHNSRVSLMVKEPAGGKRLPGLREQEMKTVDQVVEELQ